VREGLALVDDRRNAELRRAAAQRDQEPKMQPVTWDILQQVVEQAVSFATDSMTTRGRSLPFESAARLAGEVALLLQPDQIGPPSLPQRPA
jgi:hypothetical protein